MAPLRSAKLNASSRFFSVSPMYLLTVWLRLTCTRSRFNSLATTSAAVVLPVPGYPEKSATNPNPRCDFSAKPQSSYTRYRCRACAINCDRRYRHRVVNTRSDIFALARMMFNCLGTMRFKFHRHNDHNNSNPSSGPACEAIRLFHCWAMMRVCFKERRNCSLIRFNPFNGIRSCRSSSFCHTSHCSTTDRSGSTTGCT